MQSFSTYLNKKFSKAVSFTFLISWIALAIILLIWGYFSTEKQLKSSLAYTANHVSSLMFDRNLSLIHSHVEYLLSTGSYIYLRLDSKETGDVILETRALKNSLLPVICEEDASAELINVRGCSYIVSDRTLLSLTMGLLTYTIVLFVIFLFLRRKALIQLQKTSNKLVSVLDSNFSDTKEISFAIKEFEAIKASLLEKTTKLQKMASDVAFIEISKQVAHDLRSPLAVITNLARKGPLTRNDVDAISSSVNRINQISNNLLRVSKDKVILPAKRRLFLKNEIIESIRLKRIEYPQMLIETLVSIPDEVCLWTNPSDFKRVISNLINNASEAVQAFELRLEFHWEKDLSNFSLSIRDNGPGFQENVLRTVHAGTSVSSKTKGHGLGLKSLIDYIVSVGGSYEIKNLKVGSEIRLIFPSSSVMFAHTPLVIVDDDKYVRSSWISSAKILNIPIIAFPSMHDFSDSLIPVESEIYLDSQVGSEKGEQWVSHFIARGFSKISLATGRQIDDFENLEFVNDVIGKEFPYQ